MGKTFVISSVYLTGTVSDGEQVLVSLVLFIIASSKRNKKLFIIDDPVSSYDEYRRKIIYDLMLSSYKQKTLLLLSHDSVFARYACESKHKGSRAIGNISYLYNDGKSKASLMDINQDSFARFDELLVDRYKNTTQYYQKIILLRLLFENRHKTIEYSYLSKILHGISENCMNNWLAKRNKTEKLILKIINEHLADKHSIKSNYLEEMPKEYYKNIDISNYSVFEKAIITRELDKNKIICLKPSIRNEINNYIHLGDTMVITIDVFKYPFITKNLFDVINKNPQVVSIMK